MKKTILLCAVLSVFELAQTGCATIRVKSGEVQGEVGENGAKKKLVSRWFWGYLWNGELEIQTCESNKLQSVHVKTNFWEAVVTIATLGIYCPVDVEWICAKPYVPDPCPVCPGTEKKKTP